MKPTPHSQQHQGYVLIEALVAFIVVAIGMLGVGKLNALLTQGTGASKAKAEAIQVAQGYMEDLRNYDLQQLCNGVNANALPATYAGTNATFTVTPSFTDINVGNPAVLVAKEVDICLTWDDGACNTPGNRVVLRSVVSCTGLGTSARVTSADIAAGTKSGFIKTPSGRAEVGGRRYNQLPSGSTDNTDGTYSYTNPDGTRELLVRLPSGEYQAMLSTKALGCETAAPDFSTVSGRILVQTGSGQRRGLPMANDTELQILSSDATYCVKQNFDTAGPSRILPDTASGNSIQYYYANYTCYMGPEWYGNVSLLRIDAANPNDTLCVGSPTNSANGVTNPLFAKHPQVAARRAYRGYRETGNGIYKSVGIGQLNTTSTQCAGEDKYVPTHYVNHDFVHVTLSGSTTCSTVETAINTLTPNNTLGTGTGAPTKTGTVDTTLTFTANNNPGRYYCLSADDGVSCPSLTEPGATPVTTTISGTITRHDNAELTGISTGLSTICDTAPALQTDAVDAQGRPTYLYSCSKTWTEPIFTLVNGVIHFQAVGTASLCYDGAVPNPSTVQYSVTNSGQDDAATTNINEGNAVILTSVPVDTQSIQNLNFSVRANAAACGLGIPQVSWTDSTSRTLAPASWTTVAGAAGYNVYQCQGTGTLPVGGCTPGTTPVGTPSLASNAGTVTFTPPPLSDNTYRCYQFTATASTSESNRSIRLCVARGKNQNAHSYQ